MNKALLSNIASIRISVGFLGETAHYGWWPSAFWASTSKAFLGPIFPQTVLASQYYGVKAAATRVHDDHIGVGQGVYHLFRLPQIYEIEMHRLLNVSALSEVASGITAGQDNAMQFLREYADHCQVADYGPVRVGAARQIKTRTVWQKIARYYSQAFESGNRVFPYFVFAQ